MNLHIRGGRIIDPSQSMDREDDLWIRDGRIAAIGDTEAPHASERFEEIDSTGAVVAPGFVDLHVHFRDPGQTHKEDLDTGTQAAVAGGFTSVCCMPNTNPPNDSVAITKAMMERAREVAHCHVYPIGAITKGLKGEELSPMRDLKDAGCVAFSDDGRPVNQAKVMRQALQMVKELDACLIEHCEELSFSDSSAIHDGDVAKQLGLQGVPESIETLDAARTLVLAAEVGARVHLAHLSCAGSVNLLRVFRKYLPGLTAEVAPHHLVLTHDVIREFGTMAKMYPPLRTEEDCTKLLEALRDGEIDAIATDHAPHTDKEKNVPYDQAAKGIVGLETALAVLLPYVRDGKLTLNQLVDRLSTSPAKVLGLPAGSLQVGMSADLVIFDPNKEVVIRRDRLHSRSKNTPFDGYKGLGKVLYTIVGGDVKYKDGTVQ